MSEANNENQGTTDYKALYEKEVEKRQKYEAKATHYEKTYAGYDIEALKAAKEERDLLAAEMASKSNDPKAFEAELDKRTGELRKTFQNEKETYEQKINRLAAENKELKVVDKVFAKANADFVPGSHEILKRDIRENLDIDDEGNIYVKGADGKPVYSKEKPAERMTVDEYLKDFATKYPFMVANKALAGTKAADGEKINTGGGGTIVVPKDISSWGQRAQEEWISQSPEHRAAYKKAVFGV